MFNIIRGIISCGDIYELTRWKKIKWSKIRRIKSLALAIISIGNDDASNVYIKQKQKIADFLNVKINIYKYENTTDEEILELIDKLNNDNNTNGIIVQLPIPSYLDKYLILNSINPSKDVDGLTSINYGKLLQGLDTLIPCTPKAIIDILDYYNIDVNGKNVLVIGRSNLVGKPIATLLTNRDATVTIAHSKTSNLKELCLKSDIIISAVGKVNLITEYMVNNNVCIIDVGINYDENNKLCGDVDFNNVKDKCSYITPVPGGVGPMTVYELFNNLYEANK